MASGDIIFAATGVTDGSLLNGVKYGGGQIETHTVIMRSASRTVRWIYAEHMELMKFGPDGRISRPGFSDSRGDRARGRDASSSGRPLKLKKRL